ncbi:hypothetical protein GCM10007875_21060 [Limnobacter litoralis]|uniref:histidine kinase n=2 Tax=Limnobacter litoralis TaxID=481366 RepID=A0ABQ5YUC1_9BURK|nr:hypothetical protein GCM10007875_21060 [Limnobacter litoralis]
MPQSLQRMGNCLSVELLDRQQPTQQTSEVQRLAFRIEDTGICMAPETLDRVFQPFRQADPSITRRFGGTGLGLSIVKRLCEFMGGLVYVTSKAQVGSCFTIELPFKIASETELQSTPQDHNHPEIGSSKRLLNEIRVLLVDDCPTNLRVAGRVLANQGAIVSSCKRGSEALKWLQETTHQIDVVLMDIQMPEMDGYTAVREIRSIDALKRLPVIALSAGALASEKDKALQSGMDDYLTKPLNVDQMVMTIRKFTERSIDQREVP